MIDRTPPAPKVRGLYDEFEELHTALDTLMRLSRLYGTSVRLWALSEDNERIELERDDLATLFDTLAEVAGHELERAKAMHSNLRIFVHELTSDMDQ
jgi:hypothetical protein